MSTPAGGAGGFGPGSDTGPSTRDPGGPGPYPRHLEPRYLRAISAEWRRVNHYQLHESLRPPAFELIDSTEHLGRWSRQVRTIQLSRDLVHRQPWGVVVEVLRHEIAHQYAHEVLNAIDEVAHGPAFRSVCARLGIDPAAAGLPAPNEADRRIHRRVEKLLALAGSDNQNEAEAAMAEARRLLLVHNLDTPPSNYGWKHLGKPTRRVAQWWRQLAVLLGEHFFVETLWVQVFDVGRNDWASVLEICGTPGNLDMAAWVHDWLVETAERLWLKERDSLRLGGPADHARYLGGVIRGFSERLREGARQCAETGLVWVRDAGAQRYVGDRHGQLRTITFAVRSGDAAWNAGVAQGKELVLHRPVRGGTGGGGKLLTGPRGGSE